MSGKKEAGKEWSMSSAGRNTNQAGPLLQPAAAQRQAWVSPKQHLGASWSAKGTPRRALRLCAWRWPFLACAQGGGAFPEEPGFAHLPSPPSPPPAGTCLVPSAAQLRRRSPPVRSAVRTDSLKRRQAGRQEAGSPSPSIQLSTHGRALWQAPCALPAAAAQSGAPQLLPSQRLAASPASPSPACESGSASSSSLGALIRRWGGHPRWLPLLSSLARTNADAAQDLEGLFQEFGWVRFWIGLAVLWLLLLELESFLDP